MKNFAFAVLLWDALLTRVMGLQAPIPGYGLQNFTWVVNPNITGGGPVNVSGSLEDVVDYLNTTYPNYPFATFPPFNETSHNPYANGTGNETRLDHTMEPYSNGTIANCFEVGAEANAWYVYRGVKYLWGLDGSGANGPGPGNCGRVSCSYNSAIWWCNDNTETFSTTFKSIGDGAMDIQIHCYDKNHFFSGGTSGQNFFNEEGWNVIVRYDDDNC